MKSKEALERLKTHIVLLEERVGVDNTGYNPYVEDYRTVEKDLELLDIIKRNVGIRLFLQEWSAKESKVFPNDRKAIKEWLENE